MMSSDISQSVAEREERAYNLMLHDNVKPKDAMKISGCNYPIGGKKYRRICQKVNRKRKKTQTSQKVSKMKRLEAQLQQHKKKQDSIQQFRHEANRAIADKRVLKKRFEQVSSALEDSRRRYCVGDLCVRDLCVFCRFENQHYQSHKIQQESNPKSQSR